MYEGIYISDELRGSWVVGLMLSKNKNDSTLPTFARMKDRKPHFPEPGEQALHLRDDGPHG